MKASSCLSGPQDKSPGQDTVSGDKYCKRFIINGHIPMDANATLFLIVERESCIRRRLKRLGLSFFEFPTSYCIGLVN